MTSRYALYAIDKISKRFAPESGVPKGVRPRYNIGPASLIPVIINRGGVNQITLMKWGFIAAGAKDTNAIFRYKTQIARSEGIFDKPTWANVIRTQRCLIPANGFYEWRNNETVIRRKAEPYYIRPTDQQLFAFAGVYGTWTDPDGTDWDMCAIITTNSGVDSVMTPSRLPVIVHPDDESDWLNPTIGDINSLYKIMRPYDTSALAIIRVSDDINSTKTDNPSLIVPLGEN
jgi:putative SOS response-associated peptidase YedK